MGDKEDENDRTDRIRRMRGKRTRRRKRRWKRTKIKTGEEWDIRGGRYSRKMEDASGVKAVLFENKFKSKQLYYVCKFQCHYSCLFCNWISGYIGVELLLLLLLLLL
jgi:hypothetical protein